jgi:uncharacterized protein
MESHNIKPVVFTNKEGYRLFGMLHQPRVSDKRNIGIILLNPGFKSRVGPHRLYNKMAEVFSEMGFNVLRFDSSGLGDSEGEIKEFLMADFYRTVQVGRFVDDTIAAMDWMEKECGVSKFILSGLCGGAITGLLAGAKDQRVGSLIGLGLPVVLDGSEVDKIKNITEGQLKSIKKGYLNKLLNLKAWTRFMTLKSNYRLIIKSLFRSFINQSVNHQNSLSKEQITDASWNKLTTNFNPHFLAAFKEMVSSSKKILLIFSEADRLHWEFEEKFMKPYQDDFKKYETHVEIHLVKNANHIFSDRECLNNMLDVSTSWLRRY